MQKIIKHFNSLLEKTLFKIRNKRNKNLGYIVKYFNVFVQETLFKLKYKTNNFIINNSKISNFNKSIIIFISLLFIYLFYLSIPTLYSKIWVQNTIEDKLLKDFKINFSISSDITYNILPTPHFLVKNSKIFRENDKGQKKISEIKKLKVFINQNNFFNKENINIKEILIVDANIILQKEDLIFLNKKSNDKFSNKNIKIKNSNIFLKNDDNSETIAIIKVPNGLIFYDDLKKLNSLNLEGEIFKTAFILSFEKIFSFLGSKIINIEAKKLKLNIFNESTNTLENQINGINIFSILNYKIKTKYNINKNLINFEFDKSTMKHSNIHYKGKLSSEPFDLTLDINLEKYDLSKLLNTDSIISELFKSKILFNENISAKITVNIASNQNDEFFKSSIINFHINNGKINFNETKLSNKKIGFLNIEDSQLLFENDQLIFNADILLDIPYSNNLFSLLQTPRKYRKQIKTIFINLDYNFFTKGLNINNLKIDDNESNNIMMDIIHQFNNSNDYNLNKSRRMLNQLFSAYAG